MQKYFRKQTEQHAPGKPLPSTNHNGRKHARVKTKRLQPELRVYAMAVCTDGPSANTNSGVTGSAKLSLLQSVLPVRGIASFPNSVEANSFKALE